MNGVLVDTSVWVDHFKNNNPTLINLLLLDLVLVHPLVLGEIACGTPPDRSKTLSDLDTLSKPKLATLTETMAFVDKEKLFAKGCGLVDLTLLTSTLITPEAKLWTLDKRLQKFAKAYKVNYL